MLWLCATTKNGEHEEILRSFGIDKNADRKFVHMSSVVDQKMKNGIKTKVKRPLNGVDTTNKHFLVLNSKKTHAAPFQRKMRKQTFFEYEHPICLSSAKSRTVQN